MYKLKCISLTNEPKTMAIFNLELHIISIFYLTRRVSHKSKLYLRSIQSDQTEKCSHQTLKRLMSASDCIQIQFFIH